MIEIPKDYKAQSVFTAVQISVSIPRSIFLDQSNFGGGQVARMSTEQHPVYDSNSVYVRT